MDWCAGDPDELEQLYDEFIKQDIDSPDLSDAVENNNIADNMAESEATALLSLHLDLLNRNLDKNGKWEVGNNVTA